MELEVTPPPDGDERAAIAEALAAVLPRAPAPRSLWWAQGVAENVRADVEDPRAAG